MLQMLTDRCGMRQNRQPMSKQYTLTVRLEREEELTLSRIAARAKLKKTEVIRLLLKSADKLTPQPPQLRKSA